MTPRIEHRGKLIHECSLPGHTRADGLYPGHINAAQLSASRFFLIYTTRGWRGTDDNASVIYQLREGAYDGRLLAEGVLASSVDDWDPLGDGTPHVRGHFHPVVFGVAAGARPASPAAGHFVAMWGRHARSIDPRTGLMQDNDPPHAPPHRRGRVGPVSVARRWRRHRVDGTAGRPAPARLRQRLSAVLDRCTFDAPDLHATGTLYGVGRRSRPTNGWGSTPSTAVA